MSELRRVLEAGIESISSVSREFDVAVLNTELLSIFLTMLEACDKEQSVDRFGQTINHIHMVNKDPKIVAVYEKWRGKTMSKKSDKFEQMLDDMWKAVKDHAEGK